MTRDRTTFDDVLELVREGARTETQKGARFERLMARALPLIDPDCARVVTRGQLTVEQAARLKIPSNDTGIDLIGFTADDPDGQESVIAIQCKCYDANTSVTKSDLDSFLVHGQKRTIKRLLWVDTSWRRFSPNLERHVATIDKWSRIDLETLGRRRIDWQATLEGAPRRDPLTPNAVQREAIGKVVDGLERHDRGQCLMACGTGKTLVAQRIAEAMTPGGGRIIVFVPSRALLKQTLEAWQDNQTAGIRLCAVCSDTSVGNEIYSEDLRLEELDCPVTTRAEEIADAWRAHAARGVRSVTISTYQSSERISEAQAVAGDAGRFDLAIADEAHCTAGTGADEGPFRLVHYESRIRARKRLYMTATPQIWSANVHRTAKKTERPNFSMDNEARFGPVLYDLPFAEAVRQKLICEITLVVQTTSSRDVLENRVNSDQMARLGIETDTATRMTGVYNAMHSRRALNGERDDTPVKRAVFFSNRIRESKRLTADFNALTADIRSREPGLRPVFVRHVDGTMPMSHRAKEIAWLKEDADDETRHAYFARHWCAQRYQVPNMLPTEHSENRLICIGGQGDDNELSVWMTDQIPDLGILGKAQVFPEYRVKDDGQRIENVTQSTLKTVRDLYDDPTISNSDVFEFAYGRLHDPEYRRRFRNEIRKDVPRITWPEATADFRRWQTMGAELAGLHLGWEDVEPFPLDEEAAQETLHDRHHYRPIGPRWLDRDERTRLRLNDRIILGGIPAEAHEWKLAGVSALHGLVLSMKRLWDHGQGQIEESGNDRYWVDTIGRAVTVALETIRIVKET